MTNTNRQTAERVEEIAAEIIRCKETKCRNIVCKQDEGYYPRAFFLFPADSQMELAIVGVNPGNSRRMEREFYIALGERHEDGKATFKDCDRIWRSIAEDHDYYQKPLNLLKGLGLKSTGILWAEVVFCEKLHRDEQIPNDTFEICSSHFLKTKIARLLSECKYVVCLGKDAFDRVIELDDSSQWKVIGVHHPTGGGGANFGKYFEKGNKWILKRKIREDFDKLERMHKTYKCKVTADKIILMK